MEFGASLNSPCPVIDASTDHWRDWRARLRANACSWALRIEHANQFYNITVIDADSIGTTGTIAYTSKNVLSPRRNFCPSIMNEYVNMQVTKGALISARQCTKTVWPPAPLTALPQVNRKGSALQENDFTSYNFQRPTLILSPQTAHVLNHDRRSCMVQSGQYVENVL